MRGVEADQTWTVKQEHGGLRLPLSPRDHFGRLLGKSVAMRRVFALLERVAPLEATLLIEGETGTGKELVAEGVHSASPRSHGPFIIFDCSAVADSLIESELFGHVRGAFTGATRDRLGRFEEASGGTLFLDEIGELSPPTQAKLLRALESRVIYRVGDNQPRPVDVRIVAATNRFLAREVDHGNFREDLYYRLAVIPVRLPPLRERREDIPMLVRHFESQWATHAQQPPSSPLSESVVNGFKDQAWSGNVRELRNSVDLALALSVPAPPTSELHAELAGTIEDVDLSIPLKVALKHIADIYKRAYMERALEQTCGNITEAAQLAGVRRAFVHRVIKRYGLTHDRAIK